MWIFTLIQSETRVEVLTIPNIMSNTLPDTPAKPRVNYQTASPEAVQAMVALEGAVRKSGLEASLLELVKMRASQLNGCAFCLDMHSRDARQHGESERRLYLLQAWREAPLFTERERAALAWTEAVTLISANHVPDDVFEQARQHFSETELVNLTLAVVAINGWNRFAISFRIPPPANV
ncbi:MAG: hypothetical protein JWO94_839 [Verrucomicrobiaceae bacterium]|nr:hypothetical protein [Verrucomicrobiaceae bacterium]